MEINIAIERVEPDIDGIKVFKLIYNIKTDEIEKSALEDVKREAAGAQSLVDYIHEELLNRDYGNTKMLIDSILVIEKYEGLLYEKNKRIIENTEFVVKTSGHELPIANKLALEFAEATMLAINIDSVNREATEEALVRRILLEKYSKQYKDINSRREKIFLIEELEKTIMKKFSRIANRFEAIKGMHA